MKVWYGSQYCKLTLFLLISPLFCVALSASNARFGLGYGEKDQLYEEQGTNLHACITRTDGKKNLYNQQSFINRLFLDLADLTTYQNNCLQLAARKGLLKTVKKVIEVAKKKFEADNIEYTAFINHKNISGATALHIASEEGYAEIVQMLLDAGAEKNVTMTDDKTPLDLAIQELSTQKFIAAGSKFPNSDLITAYKAIIAILVSEVSET